MSGRSLLIAGVAAIGIYACVTLNSGYRWAWKGYLVPHWKYIIEHPKATIDQRLKMKVGVDYTFLNYVKQNTPENAVILFPLPEHVTEKSGNMQLTDNILSKNWATYFVYPRRVIYKSEAETNPLYGDITHVAICAGHGYEDLEYAVRKRSAYAVLPRRVDNGR